MSDAHKHDWRDAGIMKPHAKVGLCKLVRYVRCACGHVGFVRFGRRPPSRVVYTWNPADSIED